MLVKMTDEFRVGGSGEWSHGQKRASRIPEAYSARKELVGFMDTLGFCTGNYSPERPLVIITFDEAHIGLRRVLRRRKVPYSARRKVAIFNVPGLYPISETSYDELALPTIEDTVMLNRAIYDQWVTHLCHPLFGSNYGGIVNDGEYSTGLRLQLPNTTISQPNKRQMVQPPTCSGLSGFVISTAHSRAGAGAMIRLRAEVEALAVFPNCGPRATNTSKTASTRLVIRLVFTLGPSSADDTTSKKKKGSDRHRALQIPRPFDAVDTSSRQTVDRRAPVDEVTLREILAETAAAGVM
ncbi:hypothetical protein EDB87DRAFT_1581648 [Lactarius vividus]|nr:hypothetical protein EDB87DRAFT_1581648 [Lactarius vividus]